MDEDRYACNRCADVSSNSSSHMSRDEEASSTEEEDHDCLANEQLQDAAKMVLA